MLSKFGYKQKEQKATTNQTTTQNTPVWGHWYNHKGSDLKIIKLEPRAFEIFLKLIRSQYLKTKKFYIPKEAH